MIAMTLSMFASASARPRRRCARSSAFLQVELRPPDDDRLAVIDEVPEKVAERQDPRLVVDDRQEDDAERRLHRGHCVQLVQHDLGVLAALQLDHHADSVPVRLVAQVRDSVDLLVVDELRDAFHELGLVDLVGNLRHDDRFLVAARRLFDHCLGPDLDDAAARRVGVANAGRAMDECGGGEVRALDFLHELGHGRVGLADQLDRRIHDLTQVVRRDVRRHTDRDARRAVDEKVRKLRRKDRRLDERAVVVGYPVDGFLFDVVPDQFRGELRQAHFRVPHGRRVVPVDRAEVALAVDERVAHREFLRHPDHRVVYRALAVRVVFAEHVSDDAGGLLVRAIVEVALLPHPEEGPPVDRLQPVADVGQGASDDDGHRVVEVRAPDLVLDRDGKFFFAAEKVGHALADGLQLSAVSHPSSVNGNWLVIG